jgi:phage regulator Rha-like protein
MSNIIKYKQIENKILTIRGQCVIIDSDVAELYGVETKEVNRAVSNNRDKFPEGYIFELKNTEKLEVVKNFHHLEKIKFSAQLPKAFTEKGLYMLATILKSKQATQTTIAIIETFTKIRELTRTVNQLSETTEKSKQKTLMQQGGEIIAEILNDDRQVTDTETSFEINFALMKFKHVVKQKKKKY